MAVEARGVTRRNRFESSCVRCERVNPTAGRRYRVPGTAGMTNHTVVIGLRLVILGMSPPPQRHSGRNVNEAARNSTCLRGSASGKLGQLRLVLSCGNSIEN